MSSDAPAAVRLRDSLRPAGLVFAAVWIGWALVGLVTVGVTPHGTPLGVPGLAASPLTAGWHNVVDVGFRSDALWYVRIAQDGYHSYDSSAAFFPGYPLAIHVVAWLPGVSPQAAATLVAQVSFLGALTVFHALTRREFGERLAGRSIRYLAVFPTAFFFVSALSESLFLLLVLLAFWYARADRWWAVLVPAALAGATRSAGVALLPALLVEALLQGRRAGRTLSPRLVAAAAPVAGLGGYLGWWAVQGHARAPLDAQRDWGREGEFPLVTLGHAWRYAWDLQSYWLVDLVVVAIVVLALIAGLRSLGASYLTYSAASLLLPLSDPFPSRPLLSVPRFVIVIFPAMWSLARLARWRWVDVTVTVGFAAGFVFLGTLFANSYSIF